MSYVLFAKNKTKNGSYYVVVGVWNRLALLAFRIFAPMEGARFHVGFGYIGGHK